MNSKNDQESNRDIKNNIVLKVRADNPQRRFRINPPPDDMCCEICGRNVDQLEPYTDVEELEEIIFEYTGGSIQYVTKDHKLRKDFREFSQDQISASWECKDCSVLSTEVVLELRKRRSNMK